MDNTRKQTLQSYKRSIEIIQKVSKNPQKIDVLQLVINLAKKWPSILIEVYEETTKDEDVYRKVVVYLRNNEKIPAIKYYQDTVKCSLLEAKNFVDNVQDTEGL
jgi:ribosomal protein L7/L12